MPKQNTTIRCKEKVRFYHRAVHFWFAHVTGQTLSFLDEASASLL